MQDVRVVGSRSSAAHPTGGIRVTGQPCWIQRSGLFITLMVLSAPLYAMTPCPSEYGPKSPLINLFGWLVVALGVVAGGLFAACLLRRSRRMQLFPRLAVALLGLVGMAILWAGGLALATAFFFLRC